VRTGWVVMHQSGHRRGSNPMLLAAGILHLKMHPGGNLTSRLHHLGPVTSTVLEGRPLSRSTVWCGNLARSQAAQLGRVPRVRSCLALASGCNLGVAEGIEQTDLRPFSLRHTRIMSGTEPLWLPDESVAGSVASCPLSTVARSRELGFPLCQDGDLGIERLPEIPGMLPTQPTPHRAAVQGPPKKKPVQACGQSPDSGRRGTQGDGDALAESRLEHGEDGLGRQSYS